MGFSWIAFGLLVVALVVAAACLLGPSSSGWRSSYGEIHFTCIGALLLLVGALCFAMAAVVQT
jgi:hypothetical protein